MPPNSSTRAELLDLAKSLTEVDLYALLNIPSDTAATGIHRAWRQAALRAHPDKAGAAFDPKKYEQLEHARDVLADDEARKLYDGARQAKVRAAAERNAMDSQRRRFLERLEKAEADERMAKDMMENPDKYLDPELARLKEQARHMLAEKKARREADEARRKAEEKAKREEEKRDLEKREAELQRRLDKVARKQARKAKKAAVRGKVDGAPGSASPAPAGASSVPPHDPQDYELVTEGKTLEELDAEVWAMAVKYEAEKKKRREEASATQVGGAPQSEA